MSDLLTPEGRAAAWLPILDQQVAALSDRTGVDPADFGTAGRITKETPYGEDLAWWMDEGIRQAELYAAWYARSGWTIARMPDGKPGIEWEAEVEIGGREVKLIIDCIYENAFGTWIVVDYKTGKWTPSDSAQLGLYATAVEMRYGRRPEYGAFYMARRGQLEGMSNLAEYNRDFFEAAFSEMNAQVDENHFPPNPGNACKNCFVKQYCIEINGPFSHNYPLVIKEQ